MTTTRLSLMGTPQAHVGLFAGKYSTQITQFGLMGVTMKRYGSFSSKIAPIFRPAWALASQQTKILNMGVR